MWLATQEAVQVMVGAVDAGADWSKVGGLAPCDPLQVTAGTVKAGADQVKKVGWQVSGLCR